jgi:hypothetical protein
MKTGVKIRAGAALAVLIAAVLPARAALLVQEDFSSYANGTITSATGLTNGTGWSGGWSYAGTGANLQIVDKTWSSVVSYGFTPAQAVTTADSYADVITYARSLRPRTPGFRFATGLP